MAKCQKCGINAGLLNDICVDCEKQQNIELAEAAEQERRAREEQQAQARQERAEAQQQQVNMREKEKQDKLNAWRELAIADFKSGSSIFQYDSIYLPVDSFVNNEQIGHFNLGPLQAAGLAGWKVLAVIPRTVGVGLTNVSYGASAGETWGAGLGGNVAGVHVLLCKEINSVTDPDFENSAVPTAADLLDSGVDLY